MKENRMQITEEARRAAAIAVAVEVNGWPGAASLPYHPTDPTVADTMRRITDVALEAAVPLLAPQPIASREPEDKALEGIHRWYAAMDAEEDSELPWPSGLSADNPNLTPAAPQPVVDREALIVTLHKAGAYCGDCNYEDWDLCEDCLKVLGSYADAVLTLINGTES